MNNEEHLLKVPPGEKPGPQLSQERRLPPPSTSQTEAWGPPGAQSSGQQVLETQDWVSTPLESRHPSRHWCLNIDERRQRAMESASGTSGQGLDDILQVVAQLASKDVDKDVLISNLPRSAESTQGVLGQSTPLWPNRTSETSTLRWPPS
uniref:Testis expressed 22 n=1 Tax=Molossus molossus TaxID=27622 RepID=A0A7J8K1D5_MOLMO|nr:testis expressed 22 [Molossus molossus]